MKDPLDYTADELKSLSTDELSKLLLKAESGRALFNTRQLAEKTIINALYGAMGNRWFPLFNEDMAAAITGNGRFFIRKLAKYIEDELQKLLPQNKPYIIYGDTDSCVGSTLIKTNQGDIKIEDLFESLSGEIEIRDVNNFIKHVKTPIKAASVSNDLELQYNNINYVMKHKVQKRLFKIKHCGDEVIITEDHSIMVIRNGELIEIKPKNIKKTDKIVKILTRTL